MLSVVADETARVELRGTWTGWPARAPGACLPPPWRPRSRTIWPRTQPSGMSAAGGWWCATAMLASVNLHQADRIIGAITAAPTPEGR